MHHTSARYGTGEGRGVLLEKAGVLGLACFELNHGRKTVRPGRRGQLERLQLGGRTKDQDHTRSGRVERDGGGTTGNHSCQVSC